MAALAVECWEKQTWLNRELLILDDEQCPAFPAQAARAAAFFPENGRSAVEMAAIGALAGCGGIQAWNWPDGSTQDTGPAEIGNIYYFCLPKRITIGAKRNLACSLAHGEYISTFDSDEWSAPNRITEQMATLQKTGKQVAGFHSLLFTDGVNFWRYTGAVFGGHPFDASAPGAFGTSLLYRKSWWEKHQFPDGPMNYANYEDRAFVAAAIADGAFVSVPAGEMMVARIHSDNTSPKSISGERWKPIQDASLLQQYRGLTG
jgi:glycosyltransferase involved in cell wall biosynthesis